MQGSDPGFGLRVIKVGVGVTLTLALASFVYVLLSWDEPNRAVLAAVSAGAAADAAVIWLLRERLVCSTRLEHVFLAWNMAHVVVGGLAMYADGGPTSPYFVILFVSIAFAAVSLTRASLTIVAAFDLLTLIGVAAAHGDWPFELVFIAAALLTVGFVCGAIAGEQHARLIEVQEARTEMLVRLARVIEFRDFDTGTHVERMSEYAALIADRLGIPRADVERLRAAAPMHDIGKLAVPDEILLKPGSLTAEERRAMQQHTIVGHDMLAESSSAEIELAAEIALTHHEHFDGSGYPRGLSGSDIPLAGRIVAVADVFDALTSDRVYRPAMGVADALAIIEKGRARQFDPKVLDAFEGALEDILSVRARVREPARITALRSVQSHGSAPARP